MGGCWNGAVAEGKIEDEDEDDGVSWRWILRKEYTRGEERDKAS